MPAGINKKVAKAKRDRSLHHLLRALLLAAALAFVVCFLALAPARLTYPFELEWMEGECVDHVRRLLAGQKLYVPPSLEFVPSVYPPLFFYLSAAVAKAIGLGFLPLRLLSLLSTLGCFALLFLMAKKETGQWSAGLLAAGLFAACFRIGGAWYDLARVDMLHLVLLVAALHLVRLDRGHPHQLLAGAAIALAFLTKQAALPIVLPVIAYAVVFQRRRGATFACSALLLSGVGCYALDLAHQHWYRYYVFQLPRQHEIDWRAAAAFWTTDLLAALPVALLFAALHLGHQFRRNRPAFFFWAALLVGALGASWAVRAHAGGYNNALIPAYAALSLLFACGASRALSHKREVPSGGLPARRQPGRRWLTPALYLLAIGQFCRLYYPPAAQVPTAADRRAGERLIATMRSLPGEVYLPYHGHLPYLAGKRSYAHAMAVFDVARGRDAAAREALLGEIIQAIRARRFAAVIVDSDVYAQPDLGRSYAAYPIQYQGDAFWPVTGMRTRPKYLFLPLPAPSSP